MTRAIERLFNSQVSYSRWRAHRRAGISLIEQVAVMVLMGIVFALTSRLLWIGYQAQRQGAEMLVQFHAWQRVHRILAKDMQHARKASVENATIRLQMADGTAAEYVVRNDQLLRVRHKKEQDDGEEQLLLASDALQLHWEIEELARGQLVHLDVTMRRTATGPAVSFHRCYLVPYRRPPVAPPADVAPDADSASKQTSASEGRP